MLKLYINICLVLLCASFSSAQITNRAVFDFEVGDVFHYSQTVSNPSETLNRAIKKRVIEKTYNIDSSEVSYKMERVVCERKLEHWCTRMQDSIIETYNHLDSFAVELFEAVQTLERLEHCDDQYYIYSIVENPIDTTFNGHSSIYSLGNTVQKFVAGWGLQYLSNSYYPCSETFQMVYCNKNGEEWGQPFDVLLLSALPAPPTLLTNQEVYDLDVNDIIQYRYNAFGYGYNIARLVERKVLSKEVNNEQVTYTFWEKDSLEGGNYTAQITTQTYDYSTSPIINNVNFCYMRVNSIDSCSYRMVNEYDNRNIYSTNYQQYIKGVGTFGENSAVDLSVGVSSGSRQSLLYYKKAVSGETCGVYVLIPGDMPLPPTDIPEKMYCFYNDMDESLSIYYPPTDRDRVLRLVDVMGKILLETTVAANSQFYYVPNFAPGQGLYIATIQGYKSKKSFAKFVVPTN